MAIYKKKGSPYLYTRFTLCGIDVNRSTKTSKKSEAKEYEDKLIKEIREQELLGKTPSKLWRDAAIRWLDEKQNKKSLENDAYHFEWLSNKLNHCQLKDISKDVIEDLAKKKEEGCEPATVNRMLEVIRGVLNRAHKEWQWINTVPLIRMRPEPKRRIRWLTRQEADKLLAELPEHLNAMARFALATGLRMSNVIELEWRDVDMIKRHMLAHHDQTKNKKALAVPLNEDAIDVLKEQEGNNKIYVFTYEGRPITRTSNHAWYKALKRAGIQNFRWHDLRHTWASWHVQSGTSLQELYELGGWSSFEMVLKYAHLSSSHLRAAADRISGKSSAKSVQSGFYKDGKNDE